MQPQLSYWVQGQGAVGADDLNTWIQAALNAAQLRGFIGLDNMVVFLQGLIAVGDNYGGLFYWDGASTAPDDNFSVIVPDGSLQGAWLRLTQNNPSNFASQPSYANDAAAAAGGVPINGLYRNGSALMVRVS